MRRKKSEFGLALREKLSTGTLPILRTWGASVQAPPADILRDLNKHISDQERRGDAPEWMRIICWNREEFLDTALFLSTDGRPGDCVFMPVMCLQSPNVIAWVQLDRVPVELPAFESMQPGELPAWDFLYHTYSFEPLRFVLNDFGVARASDLWVLPGMHMRSGTVAFGTIDPVRFAEFARGMECRGAGRQASECKARIKPSVLAALRDEFPWLTEADLHDAIPCQHSGQASSSRPRAHQGHNLGEPELDELRRELVEQRERWRFEDSQMFVYVRQLGGGWLMEHQRKANNAASMFTRAGVAERWAQKYGFQRMRSFFTAYMAWLAPTSWRESGPVEAIIFVRFGLPIIVTLCLITRRSISMVSHRP